MPRRARFAFAGTAVGLLAMAVTWYAAHEVAALRQADVNILVGFLRLGRPALWRVANALANVCDPVPYVFLAIVPVAIALLRGRRRVAVAILVLLVGANVLAEVLKPLLAGPRLPVPGVISSDASWPSGHTTAAMTLVLAMVIAVPSRLRPIVATIGSVFAVGVLYSLLTLGWHYPSDVLGGLELSSTCAVTVIGALWTYESHRAETVVRTGGRVTVGAALTPPLTLLAFIVAVAAAVVAARPHLLDYAAAHPAFMTAAAAIALLSFGCAAGLGLVLQRPARGLSGSGRAPTAARRNRLLPR